MIPTLLVEFYTDVQKIITNRTLSSVNYEEYQEYLRLSIVFFIS